MRRAPAYTYAFEAKGQVETGYKIGWAFDYKRRARQFNQASLPDLGGVKYTPKLAQLWDTAMQAFAMEQAILSRFRSKRHPVNHEVLVGIGYDELLSAWTELVGKG